MSKFGEDGKPIFREDGKVLKGPNCTVPNISDILTNNDVFHALHRLLACVRSGKVARIRAEPSGC